MSTFNLNQADKHSLIEHWDFAKTSEFLFVLQVFQRRQQSVFVVGGGSSCTPGEDSVAVKHAAEARWPGAPTAAGRRKRAGKGTNCFQYLIWAIHKGRPRPY